MPATLVEFSLSGDEALKKTLLELERNVVNKAIRKATRDAQKLTLAAAKPKAPTKTGKLRDAMKVRAVPKRWLQRKFKLTQKEARAVSGHGVFTGSMRSTDYPYYALFLEKGTKERGTYERHHIRKISGGIKVRRTRVNGQLKFVARRGRIEAGKFTFLKPALFGSIDAKRNIVAKEIKAVIAMAKAKPR